MSYSLLFFFLYSRSKDKADECSIKTESCTSINKRETRGEGKIRGWGGGERESRRGTFPGVIFMLESEKGRRLSYAWFQRVCVCMCNPPMCIIS